MNLILFSLVFIQFSAKLSNSMPQNIPQLLDEAMLSISSGPSIANEENIDVKVSQKQTYEKPRILKMLTLSKIQHRYAKTVVSSRVINPANISQETAFSIVLPKKAFITGFVMDIDGTPYPAHIRDAAAAQAQYTQAVESGTGAAHVAASTRNSARFHVNLNLEAGSKATFNLTYEELLERQLGHYEAVYNLDPGQIVPEFRLEAEIREELALVGVKAPPIRSGNEVDTPTNEVNPYAKIEFLNEAKTSVRIVFNPSEKDQKKIMSLKKSVNEENNPSSISSNEGISGQFVIQYDVNRTNTNNNSEGSELLINDGYFVHFFAPQNLRQKAKHVVLVLDVSGSMIGRKLQQMKDAFKVILDDLQEGDFFNIVEFSYEAKVWNLENPTESKIYSSSNTRHNYYYEDRLMSTTTTEKPETINYLPAYPANKETIKRGKEIVDNMVAYGGTNIYDSLRIGLKLALNGISSKSSSLPPPQPMLIFLTDGDATVGETGRDAILGMVRRLNDRGGDENSKKGEKEGNNREKSGIDGENSDKVGKTTENPEKSPQNPEKLMENSQKTPENPETHPKRVPIFSLAFGYDADRDFLRRLSLDNYGFARTIYEASDAALQLQAFYRSIASPLLGNVRFRYANDDEKDGNKALITTTRTQFDVLFGGAELVVAGRIPINQATPTISAVGFDGPIDFTPTIHFIGGEGAEPTKSGGGLERLWAHLTVQQLLEAEGAEAKKKALELALKYSFVTPLTSLVVVKPNSTDVKQTENAEPDVEGPMSLGFASSGGFAASHPGLPGPPPVGISAFPSTVFSSPVLAPSLIPESISADVYADKQDESFLSAAVFPSTTTRQPYLTTIANKNGGNGGETEEKEENTEGNTEKTDKNTEKVENSTDKLESSTGKPENSTAKPETSSEKPENPLNWLKSELNDKNQIEIEGNWYFISNKTDENVIPNGICQKENGNSTKICTLLHKCSELHEKLTDKKAFIDNFCKLDKGYAGICCNAKTT